MNQWIHVIPVGMMKMNQMVNIARMEALNEYERRNDQFKRARNIVGNMGYERSNPGMTSFMQNTCYHDGVMRAESKYERSTHSYIKR